MFENQTARDALDILAGANEHKIRCGASSKRRTLLLPHLQIRGPEGLLTCVMVPDCHALSRGQSHEPFTSRLFPGCRRLEIESSAWAELRPPSLVS